MIHIFIINHFAGSKELASGLRSHLAQKEGLRFFVFNTVKAGYEQEIVKKMYKYFEGEKIRFYCCGGSGTFRNMVNGIPDLSKAEVAFFPCGLTNDFIKCFGDEESFRKIDDLIDGRVEDVDYIKTDWGIAVNTVSVGIDAGVLESMNRFRVYDLFGDAIPYALSSVKGLLFTAPRELMISIDGREEVDRFTEIIFCNGCVFGGNLFISERTDVTDGIASYLVATNLSGLTAVRMILKLMKKQLREMKRNIRYGELKEMVIRSNDGRPFSMNCDGEIVGSGTKCHIQVVQNGLHFVVPRSMELKEYRLYE